MPSTEGRRRLCRALNPAFTARRGGCHPPSPTRPPPGLAQHARQPADAATRQALPSGRPLTTRPPAPNDRSRAAPWCHPTQPRSPPPKASRCALAGQVTRRLLAPQSTPPVALLLLNPACRLTPRHCRQSAAVDLMPHHAVAARFSPCASDSDVAAFGLGRGPAGWPSSRGRALCDAAFVA